MQGHARIHRTRLKLTKCSRIRPRPSVASPSTKQSISVRHLCQGNPVDYRYPTGLLPVKGVMPWRKELKEPPVLPDEPFSRPSLQRSKAVLLLIKSAKE